MSGHSERLQALFLSEQSPFLRSNPNKDRELAMLRALSEKADVEVICAGAPGELPHSEAIRVTAFPDARPGWYSKMSMLFLPEVLGPGLQPAIAAALRDRARPGMLLWLSRFPMAHYVPLGRKLGMKVILDQNVSESAKLYRVAWSSIKRWFWALSASRCAYYEERLCNASSVVVVSSEIEASRIHKTVPEVKVFVMPSAVNLKDLSEKVTSTGTALLAPLDLTNPSHVTGLKWFFRDVYPRLLGTIGLEIPKVIVTDLSGKGVIPQKLERYAKHFSVRPATLSLGDELNEALVVFFPVRGRDGNSDTSILKAMASKRAVVATFEAVENLALTPTFDIYVADDADDFSSDLVNLIRNSKLRTEMAQHALQTIEADYDPESLRPRLEQVLSSL